MRNIGEIDSETRARQFSDFLYVQKIPNQLEPGDGSRWEIWVHSDDDLTRAIQFLSAFRANPDDPQFAAARQAESLRAQEEQELKDFRRRLKTRDNLFRRFWNFRAGPLTALLICASIFVFIWTDFSSNPQKVQFLFFSDLRIRFDLMQRLLASPEIRSGEVWRLITPMFLHFGFIHIIFNMMWLRDLGGMIETFEGTAKLFALVVVSAALSNWAQYVIDGSPRFGGMSGVVYALLGYVWMKGKYQPGLGMFLHRDIVIMMMIWLVVCFTGALGPIANWAHLGGLVVGVTWGYASTREA